jgi:hypothetical protein
LPALICLSAAATPAADERAQFERERAVCTEGQSNQSRATCLKEAYAAYAQALHSTLAVGSADYALNARQRCNGLAGSDRNDCIARMQGQGTASGSVAKGGVYRELVTDGPVKLGSAAAVVETPGQPSSPSSRP